MDDREVVPVEDVDGWTVEEDHPLRGQEVTVQLGGYEDGEEPTEIVGRVAEAELFPGRARARPRNSTGLGPRPQRRARRSGVLNPGDAFISTAELGLSQGERQKTHPRLGGLYQEDRLDTFLFCSRLDKRYSGERQLSPEGGSPWRVAQHTTRREYAMTRRREMTVIGTANQDSRQFNFFSFTLANQVWKGGATAPPKTGEAGLSRPIRPTEQAQPAGGGSQSPPPASQHTAVSGGGVAPTLTADCCEAGSGGGRRD